jgi:ferredoxin
MCIITTLILQFFVAQLHAEEDKYFVTPADSHDFMDKHFVDLFERALKKASTLHHADLDTAVLGKPGHLSIKTPQQVSPFHSPNSVRGHLAAAAARVPSHADNVPRCDWTSFKDLRADLGLRSISKGPSNLQELLVGSAGSRGARPPHAVRSQVADRQETDTADRNTALELSPEAKQYYKELAAGGDFNANLLDAAPGNFFELLGINLDANASEVKAAYRHLLKIAHPDKAGEAANALNIILHSAYLTLKDDSRRSMHALQAKKLKDSWGGKSFDGRPKSRWAGPAHETRAVFVDESLCVGCKSCVLWAPHTFNLEQQYGRARCTTQWGDDYETIQTAVETCPVNCIYWVQRGQLALLEYAMKGCKREDVNIMQLGGKINLEGPFPRAELLLRTRLQGWKRQVYAGGGVGTGTPDELGDETLAGAIAAAWLELPLDVRRKGWPGWVQSKAEEAKTQVDEERSKVTYASPTFGVHPDVNFLRQNR